MKKCRIQNWVHLEGYWWISSLRVWISRDILHDYTHLRIANFRNFKTKKAAVRHIRYLNSQKYLKHCDITLVQRNKNGRCKEWIRHGEDKTF